MNTSRFCLKTQTTWQKLYSATQKIKRYVYEMLKNKLIYMPKLKISSCWECNGIKSVWIEIRNISQNQKCEQFLKKVKNFQFKASLNTPTTRKSFFRVKMFNLPQIDYFVRLQQKNLRTIIQTIFVCVKFNLFNCRIFQKEITTNI